MAGVVAGILFHPLCERAPGPVHFLRALFKNDSQMPLDEVTETKLFVTEQASCGHGVEDFARNKIERFAEHAEVVVRSVKDQFAIAERIEQWGEVKPSERINEEISVFDAELEEAKFLGIGMKRIRLGIDSDPGGAPDCCDDGFQILRIRNHPMESSLGFGNLKVRCGEDAANRLIFRC